MDDHAAMDAAMHRMMRAMHAPSTGDPAPPEGSRHGTAGARARARPGDAARTGRFPELGGARGP